LLGDRLRVGGLLVGGLLVGVRCFRLVGRRWRLVGGGCRRLDDFEDAVVEGVIER